MQGIEKTYRHRPTKAVITLPMVMHRFKTFRGLLAVVFAAGFFFAQGASAAPPAIEILSPTTNSVFLTNTSILFEAQITGAVLTHAYKVEWQFNWDGSTTDWPVSGADYYTFTTPAATEQKLSAVSRSGVQQVTNLRRQGYLYTTTGRKYYRLRVTDQTTNENAEATGSFYSLADLSLNGYAWAGASTAENGSDAIGWVSFSCANQNTACLAAPKYELLLGKTPSASFTTLQNNAWIGEESTGGNSAGWLTFNRKICSGGSNNGGFCVDNTQCPSGGTCNIAVGNNPPATGADQETWSAYNENNHVYTSAETFGAQQRYPGQVTGWARFLTLKDYGETASNFTPATTYPDWGWLHLRGPAVTPPVIASKGFQQCDDCSAGGGKCNLCNTVDTGVKQCKGGANHGSSCVNSSPDCPDGTCTTIRNYSCNSCYDCSGGKCDSCQSCNLYGVSYNPHNAKLQGFAWAGGAGANENGLGWVWFDPPGGGVGVLQAWVATRYGDIFVSTKNPQGKSISVTSPLPSPPGTFNATYVIQANGTIEFSSEKNYLQPQYPTQIKLPTAERQYINVLGRLNFGEMTKTGANRFGTTEVVTGAQVNAWGSNKVLEGKIYWVQGNLTITNPITFKPGSANASGAGTIIVDGDLTINAEVKYDTVTTVGKIINIPSVSWIVRGNVIINGGVGTLRTAPPEPNLVGAFLVVGCPGTVSGVTPACGAAVKDGSLATGVSSNLELIVNGLMMAKRYAFERTVQTDRGSEQIIYDGRFVANPPPGLQDLTGVLPIIREVTP